MFYRMWQCLLPNFSTKHDLVSTTEFCKSLSVQELSVPLKLGVLGHCPLIIIWSMHRSSDWFSLRYNSLFCTIKFLYSLGFIIISLRNVFLVYFPLIYASISILLCCSFIVFNSVSLVIRFPSEDCTISNLFLGSCTELSLVFRMYIYLFGTSAMLLAFFFPFLLLLGLLSSLESVSLGL